MFHTFSASLTPVTSHLRPHLLPILRLKICGCSSPSLSVLPALASPLTTPLYNPLVCCPFCFLTLSPCFPRCPPWQDGPGITWRQLRDFQHCEAGGPLDCSIFKDRHPSTIRLVCVVSVYVYRSVVVVCDGLGDRHSVCLRHWLAGMRQLAVPKQLAGGSACRSSCEGWQRLYDEAAAGAALEAGRGAARESTG
jgi:hypothetical protein